MEYGGGTEEIISPSEANSQLVYFYMNIGTLKKYDVQCFCYVMWRATVFDW